MLFYTSLGKREEGMSWIEEAGMGTISRAQLQSLHVGPHSLTTLTMAATESNSPIAGLPSFTSSHVGEKGLKFGLTSLPPSAGEA